MNTQQHFLIIAVLVVLAASTLLQAHPLDHWHLRRPPQSTNVLNAVTYGGGLFVAVGSSGNNGEILTSPDGMVWTSQVSGTSNELSAVAYGNGRFVAVDAAAATAAVSTNGVVWSTATNAPRSTKVAYGNGLFVAIEEGSVVYSSTDGLNWTRGNGGITTHAEDITYGSGRFVIVGRNPFISVPSVWASTNGIDWFASGPVAFQSEGLYVVTWGGGLFVAAGIGLHQASSDGEHWTRSSGPIAFPKQAAFGDGLFVTVGASNCCVGFLPYIQSSSDGLQWLARDSGWTNALNSVAYGRGTFVGVGEGGAILQSDDTRPRLSARIDAATSGVALDVTGGLVRNHRLQAAAELPSTNWTDLLTFTNAAPATNFVDASATNFNRRFYRVISP